MTSKPNGPRTPPVMHYSYCREVKDQAFLSSQTQQHANLASEKRFGIYEHTPLAEQKQNLKEKNQNVEHLPAETRFLLLQKQFRPLSLYSAD